MTSYGQKNRQREYTKPLAIVDQVRAWLNHNTPWWRFAAVDPAANYAQDVIDAATYSGRAPEVNGYIGCAVGDATTTAAAIELVSIAGDDTRVALCGGIPTTALHAAYGGATDLSLPVAENTGVCVQAKDFVGNIEKGCMLVWGTYRSTRFKDKADLALTPYKP